MITGTSGDENDQHCGGEWRDIVVDKSEIALMKSMPHVYIFLSFPPDGCIT